MIALGKYSFEGPIVETKNLEDRSGIYAILDSYNNSYTVIDIGESSEVKTRIENHDRRTDWNRTVNGIITFAVLYTPYYDQIQRIRIEQELRAKYKPTCGER